ncbi:MAG: FIST signal transduction protein [Burkholderiales bacterium]
MEQFIAAHSASPGWSQASAECLAQLGSVPSDANLGFIYVGDDYAAELERIVDYFKEKTGVEQWVGTVGMGVCGSGREYHEQPAISVMLAGFPSGSYRVFDPIVKDLSQFVEHNRDWYQATECRFGVVHGDPRNPQLPNLITDLAETLNSGFLVGGLASSRGGYAQVARTVSEGGLSGVLFGPDVAVATTLTQSCAPFGETHDVTECERNIAVRIDGRPALEVFYEEIGEILARDLNKAVRFIGVALPIPGSDTADFLVRNVVGVDPNQKLLAIGEWLHPGQKLRFCRRDAANAQKDMERMLKRLKQRLPGAPKGGVYYSCVGRGRHMFGEHSEEMQAIRREFGDCPITGFFCNGEISHNRLYGYTGVLTLFL